MKLNIFQIFRIASLFFWIGNVIYMFNNIIFSQINNDEERLVCSLRVTITQEEQ